MGELTGRRLDDRQDDDRRDDAEPHIPLPRLPRTIFFRPVRRSTVTITSGVLEIRRRGRTVVFDLTDPGTRIELEGRPGGRHWTVRLSEGRTTSYVVDGSMVDGVEFVGVLRYFRPDLRR